MEADSASSEDTRRRLLERAARATLHRLAGDRNVVDGWAVLGAPEDRRASIEARCEEGRVLMGRLGWILRAAFAPAGEEGTPPEEAPRVLLHAALGIGAPEEAGSAAPPSLAPEAALAAAEWTLAVGGPQPRWERLGDRLVVHAAEEGAAPPAWWTARWSAREDLRCSPGRLEAGA